MLNLGIKRSLAIALVVFVALFVASSTAFAVFCIPSLFLCSDASGLCTKDSDCGGYDIGGTPFKTDTPQPTIPTEGLADFGELVAWIFTLSLDILGIAVFVMIFYAGFNWFTAAGNTAKVNEAKGQVTNAILGALLLLAAWIILYTINPDFVGGVFTLP